MPLSWEQVIGNNDIKGVMSKIEYGENLDLQGQYGWTPLIWAVYIGQIDIINLLLQYDINVNIKDQYGSTALIMACYYGKIDVVRILVQRRGLDVNAQNYKGMTALMEACQKGIVPIVQMLLQVPGIDLNKESTDGQTALLLSPPPIKQLLGSHIAEASSAISNRNEMNEMSKIIEQLKREMEIEKSKTESLEEEMAEKNDSIRIYIQKEQEFKNIEGIVKKLPMNPTEELVNQRIAVLQIVQQFNDAVTAQKFICSMCLTGKKEYSSDCGHQFCYECITSWKTTGNGCVLCKKPFGVIKKAEALE